MTPTGSPRWVRRRRRSFVAAAGVAAVFALTSCSDGSEARFVDVEPADLVAVEESAGADLPATTAAAQATSTSTTTSTSAPTTTSTGSVPSTSLAPAVRDDGGGTLTVSGVVVAALVLATGDVEEALATGLVTEAELTAAADAIEAGTLEELLAELEAGSISS